MKDLKLNKNDHPPTQCKQLFNVLNKDKLSKQYSMDIEDINICWNHPNKYFDINYDLQYMKQTDFKQKHQRHTLQNKPKSKSSSPLHIEYEV